MGRAKDRATSRPRPLRRDRGRARRNLLWLAPFLVALGALGQGPFGLALDMAAAAALAGGLVLLEQGLRAEAAYGARALAHRPALPRKTLAAICCGWGAGLTAFDPAAPAVAGPMLFAFLAGGLHLAAFGLDPVRDKGTTGTPEAAAARRAATAIREAETVLAETLRLGAGLGDPAIATRLDRLAESLRALLQALEMRPEGLSAVRRDLGVYLPGARDATRSYAALDQPDAAARGGYLDLLTELETVLAARTRQLRDSERAGLAIEIDVLRDRLAQERIGPQ